MQDEVKADNLFRPPLQAPVLNHLLSLIHTITSPISDLSCYVSRGLFPGVFYCVIMLSVGTTTEEALQISDLKKINKCYHLHIVPKYMFPPTQKILAKREVAAGLRYFESSLLVPFAIRHFLGVNKTFVLCENNKNVKSPVKISSTAGRA